MDKFLGLDIGGTKCAVVLGNEDGKVFEKIRFETLDFETTYASLFEAARQLFCDEVKAIGVSCGGPLNSKTGRILSPPNLKGWDDVAIVEDLQQAFSRPAFLKNDADACAIAEWKWGSAKGYDNAVFLTCSTGMGAGLILNGKPYSGACDMAGEVGHVRLYENGRVGYGKAGSFEGCCGGGPILQHQKISMKEIALAAKEGDARALEFCEQYGRDLGRGVAVVVDLLNPQVVVLGSIYYRAQDLIEPFMWEELRREALAQSLENLKVLPAALREDLGDKAALGVAFQGFKEREQNG